MRILVIGGSYFFGRVFVMLAAKEHNVTVVNRGTCSVAELGAKQIKGDRKEEGVWKSIEDDCDCVVDFCAYEKGDIARVLENMPGRIRQYIFISTVDVYERGIKGLKGEETPLETRPLPGEAGAYIAGKVALEREVREQCGKRDISCTVLRPAILYGPLNYAPRESVYIRLLARMFAHKEIMEQMTKVHQYAIMCAPTVSQYAAIEAMKNGEQDAAYMRESYNQRRRYLYHELNRLGLPCFEPEGAFYMFPDIREFGMSSEEFAMDLLDQEKVAVVPGSAFGESGEGFIRISYAYSIDELDRKSVV